MGPWSARLGCFHTKKWVRDSAWYSCKTIRLSGRARCVGTGKCRYSVEIEIQLGPKQKGDVDNFPKVVLDGLVIAGVIHSDAAVDCLTIKKSRTDAMGSASTKIVVRLLQDSRNDVFSGRVRGA
jgi:hypothetical protein